MDKGDKVHCNLSISLIAARFSSHPAPEQNQERMFVIREFTTSPGQNKSSPFNTESFY